MPDNKKINIKLPDGSIIHTIKGITPLDVAEKIGSNLARIALAAKFNDKLIALNENLLVDGELKIITFNDDEGRDIFWHSSAHLMAQAVKRIFPEAQLGIGPAIEDGFYYDIKLEKKLSIEDFHIIEKEMVKIVDENITIKRQELSKKEAIDLFKKKGEYLKIDLIKELDGVLSVYSQGEFIDLCRGPHLPTTGRIGKNFKLLSIAGAYWRGDEKNEMLQRLYATAYPEKKLLKEHLLRLEEAQKRDHRKLGKELDLYSIQDDIGGGLVLWHPKGAIVRDIIESFWKQEHSKNGYQLIFTPHIAKLDLWEKSGHTSFYRENMFTAIPVEDVNYQLKPMNCPFHLTIYNSHLRSYRDLPIRYAELGTVYRFERSGVLHGLMRVRGFTQDDAHIFCMPEQLNEEIERVLNFCIFILKTFGFKEYDVFLSTRPEKYVGTIEKWDKAESALKFALENSPIQYKIDIGEGVFYGPKIDIKIKDVLGRSWQCSTIQVDFNLPEKFNIKYVGEDGNYHQPIMIHRALFGSLERFFGILIEQYAGNFPLWLAPIQVKLLPITERQHEYACKIYNYLSAENIRSELDLRNEKIGFKIRDAEVQKVPYMVILGDKEMDNGNISVRHKGEGAIGVMAKEDFLTSIITEIKNKK
jgi:threonyl-tRNA synthetase